MTQIQKTSDGHMHSWGSDGFHEVDDLIEEIFYLIRHKKLHPTTLLLTDHCTTKQSREFCRKINELEQKLNLKIETEPAVEMSLRYDDVYFHLIAVVQNNDKWERTRELENGLLRKQKDAYIRKYDESIKKVVEFFQGHPIISRNPDYQLTRQKIIRTAGENFIEGQLGETNTRNYHFNGQELVDGEFRKGVSFSHIVRTMTYLNDRMVNDRAIESPSQGYGTRSQIERYFNKGGRFYVSNGQFLGSLPDVRECAGEIRQLTDLRIMPHPIKTEHWQELAEELKQRFGILEGIEAFNPRYVSQINVVLEQAEKLNLKPTSGSDFHGGDYHRDQKLCYLNEDKPLPAFNLR